MERNRGGRPRHPDILTPAEWRVLEELHRGGTNAEIAVRLGVSPNAVKYHISNMLGKLDLEDRHALAVWRGERDGIRTHVRALLALPPALSSLGRTVAWAGAAGAGVAVLATVAVVVIAVLRGGDDAPRLPVAREATQMPGPTQVQEPTPQPTATEPAATQLASGVVQVSAGGQHSCAVRESGELACWGINDNGQTDAPAGSFRSVSATLHRNCAVRESGEIVCWGLNADFGARDVSAGRYRSVSAGGSHSAPSSRPRAPSERPRTGPEFATASCQFRRGNLPNCRGRRPGTELLTAYVL